MIVRPRFWLFASCDITGDEARDGDGVIRSVRVGVMRVQTVCEMSLYVCRYFYFLFCAPCFRGGGINIPDK